MSAIESRRILLVDDSADIRHICFCKLQKMGFSKIVEAADGQQALEFLETQRFDILISDYQMPKLDGGALLRRVATRGYGLKHVILFSGLAESDPMIEKVKRAIEGRLSFQFLSKTDPKRLWAALAATGQPPVYPDGD